MLGLIFSLTIQVGRLGRATMQHWVGMMILFLGVSGLPGRAEAAINAGWYTEARFQAEGPRGLTGLDIEMVRAIAVRAGHDLNFTRTTWPELLRAVASSERDLATGVAWTAERAAAGQMTAAYRQDINVLIQRRGEGGGPVLQDAASLLAHLQASAFRIGVINGFSYGDPRLDSWINDPARGPRVHRSSDDATNLRLLLTGKIDGFLAERLTVAQLIAASIEPRAVEENTLRIVIPLHLKFSHAVPFETVAAFEAAITALAADGTLGRIAARFRAPVLLSLTLNSRWFFVLEVIGTLASALAGYLAARAGRYSLFGAMVLALVTAVGGGILRDLLVGRHPIGVMSSPIYLQMVLGTVVVAYLAGRLAEGLRGFSLPGGRWRDRLFDLADAIGLGAFAVVGVAVAIGTTATPLWMWGPLLGAITGAGGGILRDIIRGGGDVPNLKTGFYGEVALIWSIFFSLWLERRSAVIEQEEVLLAVLVTVGGAVTTRMALLRMRAPGLP